MDYDKLIEEAAKNKELSPTLTAALNSPNYKEIVHDTNDKTEYYDLIKKAGKKNDLLSILLPLINEKLINGRVYLEDMSHDDRIYFCIDEALMCGLTFKDFKFLVQLYKIRNVEILLAVISPRRMDMMKYLIDYDREFYIHRDYQDAAKLVVEAIPDTKEVVNTLLFQYNIDIWNPPSHINAAEHFGKIWYKALDKRYDYFLKTFLDHGANINMLFTYNIGVYDENPPDQGFWYTPLIYAIVHKEPKVVKYLMSRNAHANNPVFPIIFAAVRHQLNGKMQYSMRLRYNTIMDPIMNNKKHPYPYIPGVGCTDTDIARFTREITFAIQYTSASIHDVDINGQTLFSYIDKLFYFDIDKHIADGKISRKPENRAEFEEWNVEARKSIKNIISDAAASTQAIMNTTKMSVMKAMKIIGKLQAKLWLSHNILGIIMEFHGGVGDAITENDLAELITLWEKRDFLSKKKELPSIKQKQYQYDNIKLPNEIKYDSILINDADRDAIILNEHSDRLSEVANAEGIGNTIDEKVDAQLGHYIDTGHAFNTAAEILGHTTTTTTTATTTTTPHHVDLSVPEEGPMLLYDVQHYHNHEIDTSVNSSAESVSSILVPFSSFL